MARKISPTSGVLQTTMIPSTSTRTGQVGGALAVLAGLTFVSGATSVISILSAEVGPVPLLAALAVAVGFRRQLGPRGLAAVMLGLLASGAVAALGVAFGLPDAIVYSHWRCGSGDVALVILLPAFAGFVTLAATLLGWALAKPFAFVARIAPLFALLGLAGGGVLLLEAARAARRPDPEAWLAALPVLGTVDAPADGASCVPIAPSFTPDRPALPTHCTFGASEVAGLRFERRCSLAEDREAEHCAVHVNGQWGLDRGVPRDAGLEIRGRGDLPFVVAFSDGKPAGAFDSRDGRTRDVRLRDVAGEIDTARGFLPHAIVGWVASLGLFLASLSTAVRRRSLRRFRNAVLDDKGWLQLADGTTCRAEASGRVAPGRVHVAGEPGAPDYRDGMRSRLRVRAGSVEEAVERYALEGRAIGSASLIAIAIALAPLGFAWWIHLVALF